MNTLTLWNGHPFASLVKLADYPEAVEVSDEIFARNVEMFRFIASECDRRGIHTIYCQTVADVGIGTALMDRLRRASS